MKVDLDGINGSHPATADCRPTIIAICRPWGQQHLLHGRWASSKAELGPEGNSGFFLFDVVAAKKETALGKIAGYEISANGQKMLVSKDDQLSASSI